MSGVIRMSTPSQPAGYRLLLILISTADSLSIACSTALRPRPHTFLSNLSCPSLVDSSFCFMLSQLIPGTVHSALRFHICFHTLSDHTHGARTSSPARAAVSMPVYILLLDVSVLIRILSLLLHFLTTYESMYYVVVFAKV